MIQSIYLGQNFGVTPRLSAQPPSVAAAGGEAYLGSADAGLAAKWPNLPKVGNVEQTKAIARATFDVAAMKALLDGPHAATKHELRQILEDPMFQHKDGLSTDEYRDRVLGWCKELAARGMSRHGFPTKVGGTGDMGSNIAAFETLAHFDLSLTIKFGVQMGLWGGSVLNLGTDKHHQALLPGIMRLDTPGCFGMTETGHGSNVKNLQTVMTYEKDTDSIVINSTTPGARKDYIGGAAKHARFATIFGQLDVNGKREGVHAIVVPIRDEKGQPLPGVFISDCGEKKGLNGVDNGRLFFVNVRVPRENLLDRFGGIDAQGNYHSTIENKDVRFFKMIGTLITGRVSIAVGANSTAKNGLATAIRYAEQRKQFGEPEERKLLDYQAHQRRLLPRLATAYALDFAIKDLVEAYVNVTDQNRRQVGDVAGAIKAMSSRHAIDTLQECREACGGQGFLAVNRFGRMQDDVDVFSTFEGDNTILNQMVAKGALDELKREARDRGAAGMAVHVGLEKLAHAWEKNPIRRMRTGEAHLRGDKFHRDAFSYREDVAVMEAASKFRGLLKDGVTQEDAVNQCQREMLVAGQARTERIVLDSFLHAVDKADPGLKPVLDQLCDLYALSTIEKNKGWYLEHRYFGKPKSLAITEQVTNLCAAVRPNAVALVDAFQIPDKCLAAPIAFGEVPA